MTTLHAPGSLEDGALIDVNETAGQAGFTVPVAVTAAHWADLERTLALQDAAGRLWDVLWLARLAAKWGGSETVYSLIMPVGRKRRCRVKMLAGPGDSGELVITLLRPDED